MSNKKKKNKSFRAEENIYSEQFTSMVLQQIGFWGLAMLLFIPPFLRGLYFPAEQQKTLMFAVLVCWLVCLWCSKNDYKMLSGSLDYFVLSLLLVYIISTFAAVNKGLAINEIVKNTLYFLSYWLASRLVRSREDVHTLLQVIYLGAVGVVLFGLLAATELININDAFIKGRIYSSFQYPNALASYLAAVFFIGSYLWYQICHQDTGEGRDYRYLIPELLYACGNFLLLSALIGTKSRGGWLVFALVYVVYLFGLGARARLSVVLNTAFTGVVAYFCIDRFIHLALDKSYGSAWLWILAGLVLVIGGQVAYFYTRKYFLPRVNDRQVNLATGVLFSLGIAGTGIWLAGQQTVLQKLMSFDFLRNVIERMYFVGDAWEMFKARPWLGWGGGGWREAYPSFQDYLYNSNQVHSFYFQVGVETGLPGLLAVAGIWLTALYYIYRLIRKRQDYPALYKIGWLLCAVFLVIAGHALIDFDLSLSALTLLLWATLGLINSLYRRLAESTSGQEDRQQDPVPKINLKQIAVISSLTLIIFGGALMLTMANHFAWLSERYRQVGQLEKSIDLQQKAVVYSPFNATYRVELAKLYIDYRNYEQALNAARQAVRLSLYSAANRDILAEAAQAARQYELALEQAEKAVSLAPFQIKWYDALAGRHFTAGYALLSTGEQQAATGYFNKVVELPEQIQKLMANLPDQYKKMWRDGPLLIPTETIYFSVGAASYQLGEYDQAEKMLKLAVNSTKSDVRARSLSWLSLVSDKKGQTGRAEELRRQAEQIMPGVLAEYDKVKELPILK